nr:SRPBCC family protein [Planosporangium thailandense]
MHLGRRMAMGVAGAAVGYLGVRAVRLMAAVRAGAEIGVRRRPPAVTIHRPPTEVYAFWRDLPNLARTLGHVTRVDEVDDRRSRWVLEGIGPARVEFTLEIVRDEPPRLIEWRAGDELLAHQGRVEFTRAPGNRGTEVRLHVAGPPGGRIEDLLYGELRRVKQTLEGGEVLAVGRRDLPARVPAATGGRA